MKVFISLLFASLASRIIAKCLWNDYCEDNQKRFCLRENVKANDLAMPCCSTTMFDMIHSQKGTLEEWFPTCPYCIKNIYNFLGNLFCSENHDKFLLNHQTKKGEVNVRLSKDYCDKFDIECMLEANVPSFMNWLSVTTKIYIVLQSLTDNIADIELSTDNSSFDYDLLSCNGSLVYEKKSALHWTNFSAIFEAYENRQYIGVHGHDDETSNNTKEEDGDHIMRSTTAPIDVFEQSSTDSNATINEAHHHEQQETSTSSKKRLSPTQLSPRQVEEQKFLHKIRSLATTNSKQDKNIWYYSLLTSTSLFAMILYAILGKLNLQKSWAAKLKGFASIKGWQEKVEDIVTREISSGKQHISVSQRGMLIGMSFAMCAIAAVGFRYFEIQNWNHVWKVKGSITNDKLEQCSTHFGESLFLMVLAVPKKSVGENFLSDSNLKALFALHDSIENVSLNGAGLKQYCKIDGDGVFQYYNLNRYFKYTSDFEDVCKSIRECAKNAICKYGPNEIFLSELFIGSANDSERSFASVYSLRTDTPARYIEELKNKLDNYFDKDDDVFKLYYVFSNQIHNDIKDSLHADLFRMIIWLLLTYVYMDFVLFRYNCWRFGLCSVIFVRATLAFFFTLIYIATSFGILLSLRRNDGVHLVPLTSVLFYAIWSTVNVCKEFLKPSMSKIDEASGNYEHRSIIFLSELISMSIFLTYTLFCSMQSLRLIGTYMAIISLVRLVMVFTFLQPILKLSHIYDAGVLSAFSTKMNATIEITDVFGKQSMMTKFVENMIQNGFLHIPSTFTVQTEPNMYSLIFNSDSKRANLTLRDKMHSAFERQPNYDFLLTTDSVIKQLESWFKFRGCCVQENMEPCALSSWSNDLTLEMIGKFLRQERTSRCTYSPNGLLKDSFTTRKNSSEIEAFSVLSLSKSHHTLDSIIDLYRLMRVFESEVADTFGNIEITTKHGSKKFPRSFFCSVPELIVEQFFVIHSDLLKLVVLPLLPCFLVLSIFSRLSWRQCMLMPSLMLSVSISMIGTMKLVGLNANAISLMNFVMVPSLSIQFFLPMLYMFSMTADNSNNDNANGENEFAMHCASVASNIFFDTICPILIFIITFANAKTRILTLYYVVEFAILLLICTIHGFVLLPAIQRIAASSNNLIADSLSKSRKETN